MRIRTERSASAGSSFGQVSARGFDEPVAPSTADPLDEVVRASGALACLFAFLGSARLG
jgi:hypothetical protein